jgi:hypothetical protein
MNGTPGGIITVGTRLRFDGGLWEVTELTASAVVLCDALGGLRQASISSLLADPATRLLDAAPAEPASAGPGISGLTPPETEEMRRLAGHVLEVLTGYQRGGEALALPGEPRPQYAPGTAKLQRCQAKAAELGVSVMTVRRMIWRFEADGPEGLIDRRRQRRNDVRWRSSASYHSAALWLLRPSPSRVRMRIHHRAPFKTLVRLAGCGRRQSRAPPGPFRGTRASPGPVATRHSSPRPLPTTAGSPPRSPM